MSAYIVKELLHYCNVNLKGTSKITRAPINYYDFTFMLKGKMTYIVNGKSYTLSENDAILITENDWEEMWKAIDSMYPSFNKHLNDVFHEYNEYYTILFL